MDAFPGLTGGRHGRQGVSQDRVVTTSPGRGRDAWTQHSGLPQAGQRRHAASAVGCQYAAYNGRILTFTTLAS